METEGLLRGRFAEATDQFVERFTASVDRPPLLEKTLPAQLPAKMLAIGVPAEECDIIVGGLEETSEIASNKFIWRVEQKTCI